MSFETERRRGCEITIPQTRIRTDIAARPRQQSLQSQHPDVPHDQALTDIRLCQPRDGGLRFGDFTFGALREQGLHQHTRGYDRPYGKPFLAVQMIDGVAHQRDRRIAFSAASLLSRDVDLDDG